MTIFGQWAKSFRPSGKTFSAGFQSSILRVHKNVLKQSFFGKKWYFFNSFGHWAKFFRLSLEKLLTGLSEVRSTCPLDHFRKKYCIGKVIIFYRFRTLSGKLLGFLSKSFKRLCQNCILRVQRKILRKIHFLQNFHLLLYHFQTISEKLMAFRYINLGRVSKTLFFVSIRTFSEKVSFFKKKLNIKFGHEQKIFCFLWKNSRQGCQNGVLYVQRNTSTQNFFWKRFLLNSTYRSKWFWPSVKNFSEKMSQLHSSVQRNILRRMNFFWKKKIFFWLTSDIEQICFFFLWIGFQRGGENSILRLQRNILRKKYFSQKKP